MMSKKQRRKLILEIIDNQIRDNNPPETKQTLDRLISEGFSTEGAKDMIGYVVISEMSDMLKGEETFNEQRFVAALNRLPEMPEE